MGLEQITDPSVVTFLGGIWTSGSLLAQVHADQPRRLHVDRIGGQASASGQWPWSLLVPVASWRGSGGKGLPGR